LIEPAASMVRSLPLEPDMADDWRYLGELASQDNLARPNQQAGFHLAHRR